MTTLQLFALFGLPVLAVAFGLLVYFLEGRKPPRGGHNEPDLFDKTPAHTPSE